MKKILILDDDEFARANIKLSLNSSKYDLYEAANGKDALNLLQKYIFNLAIVDIKLPMMQGNDFIKIAKANYPDLKFIVITGFSDEESILDLIKIGIDQFLRKPYDLFQMIHTVDHLLKLQEIEKEKSIIKIENDSTKSNKKAIGKNEIIGVSKYFKDCLKKASKAAKFQLNTLISGDTGTGKEMIANYIHKYGPRAKQYMVAVNCAELSESLFEAELYGYKKGAFTGAVENNTGLFELADGGILFLDEITEIPVSLQAKLLRIIETQKVRKISESKWQDINVQIIASTNRNIELAIQEGFLRQDLYYRLSQMHIHIPPINQRSEDVPLLIKHFIEQFEKSHRVTCKVLSAQQLEYLQSLEWPGNVREIRNFVQNWALFADELSMEQIAQNIGTKKTKKSSNKLSFNFQQGTFEEIEDAKSMLVENALLKYEGNKSQAAKHLGITYQGLLKYLKRNEMF